MAGVHAGFVTGARAKIKIGGQTMAYAADVSYNVTVATIPIETMGKYEVHSNEPVAYTVDGSFSIVRYTKGSADVSNIVGQSETGATNGTGAAGNDSAAATGALTSGTAPGNHLNPAKLLLSSSFDLEIAEKGATADISVFLIQDCRITRRGASLNKRGVLVDNYSYVAIIAGDNETDANFPGVSGMDKAPIA